MTINFDWRLVDTVLKLMPPWLVEVGRLLLAGSSSSWFGLWCPAHCSAAIPLLGAVFVAGFGAGVISALLWLVHLFRPNLFPEPSHPANPSTSIVNSRLLAYLHERPGHLPQSLKLLFLSGLLLTALNGRSTKAKTELILLLFPRVHMTGILFLSLPLLIKLLLFLTATLLPTIRLLASSPQFFSLKWICVAGLVPLRRSQGLGRKEHGRQVSGQRQLWTGVFPNPVPRQSWPSGRPSIWLSVVLVLCVLCGWGLLLSTSALSLDSLKIAYLTPSLQWLRPGPTVQQLASTSQMTNDGDCGAVTLDLGPLFLYVLNVPNGLIHGVPASKTVVVPVISRKSGVLLALRHWSLAVKLPQWKRRKMVRRPCSLPPCSGTGWISPLQSSLLWSRLSWQTRRRQSQNLHPC